MVASYSGHASYLCPGTSQLIVGEKWMFAIFNIFLTVNLRIILVGNQLYAQFFI
jgi:hypothetical protein